MNFTSKSFQIEYISRNYSIKKTILENTEYHKYTISDAGNEKKHYFICSECKGNSTMLDKSNVNINNGNDNSIKIIKCLNCESKYDIKTGYCEPNNGRDIYYISKINLIK